MIQNAYVKHWPASSYGGERKEIRVESTNKDFIYQAQSTEDESFYLGYTAEGDEASFFVAVHSNTRGFAGARFNIVMTDGSKHALVGPWSSRPAVINDVFELKDPLVECIDQRNTVTYVPKSVLERFGVGLVAVDSYGEIYWRAA